MIEEKKLDHKQIMINTFQSRGIYIILAVASSTTTLIVSTHVKYDQYK
jgi:hypothetical protein